MPKLLPIMRLIQAKGGAQLTVSDELQTTKLPALSDLLPYVAKIVAAHAEANEVAPEALPALITSVYQALQSAGQQPVVPSGTAPAKPEPAVSPKKPVFPDYLVCLEDGRHLKMLKRHLQVDHNLTPEAYRERWDLAADYPMTAPGYATSRSGIAKGAAARRPAASESKLEPEPETNPSLSPTVQRIP